MKNSQYIVAVLSLLDNENKLYFVTAETEIGACKKAIIEHTKIENKEDVDVKEWLDNLVCETVEDALNEFVQCELCVSLPLKINN